MSFLSFEPVKGSARKYILRDSKFTQEHLFEAYSSTGEIIKAILEIYRARNFPRAKVFADYLCTIYPSQIILDRTIHSYIEYIRNHDAHYLPKDFFRCVALQLKNRGFSEH